MHILVVVFFHHLSVGRVVIHSTAHHSLFMDTAHFNTVTDSNIDLLSKAIKSTIRQRGTAFVAIDTEFSGLGKEIPNIKAKDMHIRYQALRSVVMEYALMALGMSFFVKSSLDSVQTKKRAKVDPSLDKEQIESYIVYNYHFFLNCQTPYKVDPQSLVFLVKNGYDIHRQLKDGVAFIPGLTHNRKSQEEYEKSVNRTITHENRILREIIQELVKSRQLSIVVHNGLLDLMFLYHSLYEPLPESLDIFISDLADMFPGGIYDTKYTAEYLDAEESTFLSYIYRKYERLEKKKSGPNELVIQVMKPIVIEDEHHKKKNKKNKPRQRHKKSEEAGYCVVYASRGYCAWDTACEFSHDLDVILDAHLGEKTERAVRDAVMQESEAPKRTDEQETYHSACFDAFMTGYVHACQGRKMREGAEKNGSENRLYLMGKDIPLHVNRQVYKQPSINHVDRMSSTNKIQCIQN